MTHRGCGAKPRSAAPKGRRASWQPSEENRAYHAELVTMLRGTFEWANEPVEGPRWDAAMILVAALVVGPNVIRISKLLGIPRRDAVWMGIRLRHAGVWKQGGLMHIEPWMDKEHGDFTFLLDTLVASGEITRRRGKYYCRPAWDHQPCSYAASTAQRHTPNPDGQERK